MINLFKKIFKSRIIKGKVLVVIITKDYVEPKTMEAVLQQDYKDFDVLIHVKKPRFKKIGTNKILKAMKPVYLKYLNCSENREVARKIALASDAEKFLFVDSDVVIPKNTITEMMKQPFDVIGGWYKVANDNRFTCGRWIADNVFVNLYKIEPSISKVDCIGMGCAFFTRKVLKKIIFEHGVDSYAETYFDGKKEPILMGECGALGNFLYKKGYQLYMNGSVVCEHI